MKRKIVILLSEYLIMIYSYSEYVVIVPWTNKYDKIKTLNSDVYGFVISAIEYVAPRHRTGVATLAIAIFFGTGCVALPWIALWIADWRMLVWVTSLPMFLVIPAPWLLPESARCVLEIIFLLRNDTMFFRFNMYKIWVSHNQGF